MEGLLVGGVIWVVGMMFGKGLFVWDFQGILLRYFDDILLGGLNGFHLGSSNKFP